MGRAVRVAVTALAFAACSGRAPAPAVRGGPAAPPAWDPSAAARSLVAAPLVSACGTPVIDGVVSPGEWDDAVSVRFAAAMPESAGGGVVQATVQAMSDDQNLYLVYRLDRPTSGFAQSHVIELDADGSGSLTAGDDDLVVNWLPGPGGGVAGGQTGFYDDYRWDCVVDGAAAVCSSLDTDGKPPGSVDGGAVIAFDQASTTVELWHPYTGADPRDLKALPGDTIGLQFSIRLLDVCPDYPRCFGDTAFPDWGTFRPFVVGCGAPPAESVVSVRIDVKPGDPVPTIQLGSGGTTAVAVLGGSGFDASKVDAASVYFAGARVAAREDGSMQASLGDVNGDGIPDLVCHFETRALRLTPASTSATLAGETLDGKPFRGTDVVRVVP